MQEQDTKREITVRVVNNFGNHTVYPVCATARKLAELAGTKTFTQGAIAVLKELGYTLKVETPEL